MPKVFKNLTIKTAAYTPLIIFSIIIFFISLGDGIMSYVTPIFIGNHVENPLWVGIVLSMSSFFGIFFDIFIGEKLSFKPFRFFLFGAIWGAVLFPLNLLFLPKSLFSFAIAMFIWSAYYEFRGYSIFNFIRETTTKEHHTTAFSVANSFKSVAYIIGPAAAVILLDQTFHNVFYTAVLSIAAAGLLYLIFMKNITRHKIENPGIEPQKSLKKELKLLKILLKTLWPILLFNFATTMLDVSFWSMGVLYAENLRQKSELGGLFLVIYGLPSLYVGLITPFIYKKFERVGKKKISFIFGLLAGISLVLVGIFQSIHIILAFVFLASSLYGIALILLEAVFADYVARLKEEGNDVVSVNQISMNLAYSLGPIILGLISTVLSFEAVFVFTGVLIVLCAVLALIVVPRKVKMPQKKLYTALNEHL